MRLRPELEVGRLPAPMPAAQVTRPAADDGGVVGVFVHHAVADGNSVWQSIVRGKALDLDHGGGDAACYFLVPVDCRRRLLPDAGEGYFGNCLSLSYAKAAARDLAEPDAGVAHAAAAIRDAAREALANPLRRAERWAEAYAGMPRERFTPTGSSNRFAAYETDMGWGAPSLVELVSPLGRDMELLLWVPCFCSVTVANHQLIIVIRFVAKSYTHL